VVALNRTVALSMASGPAQALEEVSELEKDSRLARYQYLPAIKADLLHRLGRSQEASIAYRQALELTENDTEREFLAERLAGPQPA
jgi:RNA polymerase sigma-70 factor (ECF subfamily)